jgi:HK97 family phage portal protein
LAREAIGVAHVMERHAGRFFANGARPSGVLESPKPVGETGVVKMSRGFAAAFSGPDNAGKTPVLWDGTTYRPMAMSSVDSQFLELRVYQNIEICRAFGLPPSMAFELERATWSNAEQASREFITWTLVPWVKALESALNRALLSDEERGEYRICFDIDDTSQADLTARATAISTLITARVLNPNEARQWLGMGPRDGGNEFANPAIDKVTVNPPPTPDNDNLKPEQEAPIAKS